MKTAIATKTTAYHVAYAPAIAKAYLFHWGCNLKCRGCLCNKEINCMALEENLDVVMRNPKLPKPTSPEQFLCLDDLMATLRKVPIKEVLFEGQEASIDPAYGEITKALKEKFGCYITLNTNGVKLPDLSYTDEVVMSLKEAREIIENWRIDYNEVRPHTSLKGQTPQEYAEASSGLYSGMLLKVG